MDKVLLFGATGNLGREIAGELKKQGYGITAVARSEALAKSLAGTVDEYVIADVMRDGSLRLRDHHFRPGRSRPARLPSDGRRDLVCAGIPERLAMQMTGHKTRSVFER